jgi:AraC-like DNA-binding protein
MMRLVRPPAPILRPFATKVWAIDGRDAPVTPGGRERVLPTGEMHLVIRLSARPVQLYPHAGSAVAHAVGLATVSGMRSESYFREVSAPVRSVGVQLDPTACPLLLGASADELTGRHWALEDFWGAAASRIREQLLDASRLERQLDLFEALLAARVPRVHALHPAVALALERFAAGEPVGEVVRASGRSHRAFIGLFRRAMGVTPKIHCRLQRFQRVIRRLASDPAAPWSDVALDAGYSDQPHFSREFRELAGVTPGEYRALTPRGHHVPVRAAAR